MHTAQVPAAADAGLPALPRAAALVADLRPGRRAHPGNHGAAAAAAAGARDGNSMTLQPLTTTQGPQAHEQHGPWGAPCVVTNSSAHTALWAVCARICCAVHVENYRQVREAVGTMSGDALAKP